LTVNYSVAALSKLQTITVLSLSEATSFFTIELSMHYFTAILHFN
jgi:hypothetical protein